MLDKAGRIWYNEVLEDNDEGRRGAVIRLSVVVPVYGTEKYIRACLDSLRQQTLRDAEFILVDDASPDRAIRVMEAFAAQDGRFRILRHESNRGLFAARLTGIEAARGEYVAFLDSDDYVSVDFYRHAVECADDGGYDVVMGDTVWVEADGRKVIRPVHPQCVPEEPLRGSEVRRAFFAQEMQCYSWHTIWNKVYRRSLIENALPELRRLTERVVMCEDVAYSCVLLHQAQSLARIRGDGVFYCMHPSSSTNASAANREKFLRNYGQIVSVFEFADAYLARQGDGENRAHLMNARRWYARMWQEMRRQCADDPVSRQAADALTARLAPGFDPDAAGDCAEIWYFDRHTLPWNDGLERIRRAIAGVDGDAPEVVSFDVFDTLIQRPFRQPSDLFSMLEDAWQQANRRCILSFADARAEAETSARVWARGRREDIDLRDIYNALRVTCGASEDCADTMRHAEMEAEIAFCQPRHTGVALYRMAKALGLRVVLTSDMYLDSATIGRMLEKCGVTGWDDFFLSNERNALKWNGGLYRVLIDALGCAPEKILHIGDNWENDFIQPQKLGLRVCHHPRAMDVMTDTRRTQLGLLGLQSAAAFAGGKTLQGALSFRCMQALAANRFFDQGFAATDAESCFACSPARLGYYAVGGHVLALAQWLIRRAKADGVRKLVFLARDGWLVKQAVDHILAEEDGIITDYHPASRRCLLPALTVNPSDFYALPINVPAYSAGKLVQLLDFCTVDQPLDMLRQAVEGAGFAWEEKFPARYRYIEFIRWYLDNLYDGVRHQKAYNVLRDYYEPILTEGAACFDMGYSGRLQAALNQLAGSSVPVYFVHADGKDCERLSHAYDFEARCFYGMKPGMSGAFREFLLSSDEPPCLGFRRTEKGVEPVYGRSEYNAAARFFIRQVQENAMRFVRDYTAQFTGTPAETLSPLVCSMPFESTLRYLGEQDVDMMAAIRFEDTVFAGRDDLDLAGLIRMQAAAANADGVEALRGMPGFGQRERLSFRRAMTLLRRDRGTLKAEARERLKEHPRMMKICRAGWRVLRCCRRILKGGGA